MDLTLKDVQVVLQSKDWIDDRGNDLIFKIKFKQLLMMVRDAVVVIAREDKNPLRLHGSNVYTSVKLLLDAMGEETKVIPEAPKEVKAPVKRKKYKKRATGRRPADSELIRHRKNNVLQKNLAKVYGVDSSTISNWYSDIKRKKEGGDK